MEGVRGYLVVVEMVVGEGVLVVASVVRPARGGGRGRWRRKRTVVKGEAVVFGVAGDGVGGVGS